MRKVYYGLQGGQTYGIQVRAVDVNNKVSAWSKTYIFTATSDVTAPPVPSAPTASSRLGVVTVTWDGMGVAAEVMPSDFSYVEVHFSPTSGFTPDDSTMVGSINSAPGAVSVSDVAYNVVRYIRFISVDMTGNKSAPSAETSITNIPLVDTDIIGEIIDGANIIDGTITASDKIIGNTITGALIQALTIQAGNIAANAITTTKIATDAITANKIQAGAVEASKITIGAVGYKQADNATDNLLPNPGLEDIDKRLQYVIQSPWLYNNMNAYVGNYCLEFNNTLVTSTEETPVSGEFQVLPGDKYYIKYRAARSSAAGSGMALYLKCFTANGTFVGNVHPGVYTTSDPTGYTLKEGLAEIPATAYVAQAYVGVMSLVPSTAVSIYFDDMMVRKAMSGTSPTGQTIVISPQGLNLTDSSGNTVISITSTPPNFISIFDANKQVASITDAGDVAARDLMAYNNLYNRGLRISDETQLAFSTKTSFSSMSDYYGLSTAGAVNTEPSLLDMLPRGVVGVGTFYADKLGVTTNSIFGTIRARLFPGRMYKATIRSMHDQVAVGDAVRFQLMAYHTSGLYLQQSVLNTVTPEGSGVRDVGFCDSMVFSVAGTGYVLSGSDTMQLPAPGEYYFRLYVESLTANAINIRNYSIAGDGSNSPTMILIEDIGPSRKETGANDVSGIPSVSVGRFLPNWTQSYQSSGSIISGRTSMHTGFTSGTYGIEKSMFGFGSTLTSNFASDTILRMELIISYKFWAVRKGTAYLGFHGDSSASAPGTYSNNYASYDSMGNWSAPGQRRFVLSGSIAAGFKSGTYRGFTLGNSIPSTSPSYAGIADGLSDTNPPELIVYWA